jgi:multiple sugar transport system substrate-binding protein
MGEQNRVSRRQALRGLGGGALVVVGSALLAACASTPAAPTPGPAQPAAPAAPTATPAPAASLPPTPTAAPAAPTATTAPAPAAPTATTAPKPAEKIKMTFWFWGDPNEKASNEKIVAQYNAATPGSEIVPVHVPQDFTTKLETAASGGQAPDIFYIQEASYYKWASAGLLLDQKPYLDSAKVDAKSFWHPQAQWWFKGKYFGTSISLEDLLVFYNADVFKKAGVPEPPHSAETAWKWADFVSAARKVTTDASGKHPGDSGFNPARMNVWGTLPARWWGGYAPFLAQTGAKPFGSDYTKSNLTDESFVGPVQALADLAVKEKVSPLPTDLSGTNGVDMFLTGKIAMYFDGQWALQTLTVKPPKIDLRIGVLPVYGGTYKTAVFGAPAGVLGKTKTPDPAVQFALFFTDNGKALLNLQTGLWMGTTQDYLFGDKQKVWVADAPEHHPANYVEAAIGTINLADEFDYKRFAGFHEAWDLLIGPALDPVWAGTTTTMEAMTKITPQINDMLQKVNKDYPPALG